MQLLPAVESKLNPRNWFADTRARSTGNLKDGAVAKSEPGMDLEDRWVSEFLLQAAASSGATVTPQSALGVSTVYACVSVLASAVASLPVQLYRRLPDGSREVQMDHPLYDLLHSAPNEEMTSVDFRHALQCNLSLRQNAYAQIVRAERGGWVMGLYPLHNSDVCPRRDPRTGEIYYEISNGSKVYTLAANEVLHLRGMSFDGILAPDMLRTVRNVVGLAITLDDNVAKFFKNGSFPGGFLEHPGKLTKEAAQRLRKSFESQTGGSNAYRLKVLEEGLKYSAGRTPNRDAQLDESRDRQAKEIARLFRVPGHKVGIIGDQPRANVEQENLSFVIDTLRPLLVTWEQAMNQKLLTRQERAQGYYFEFNIAGMLRGSIKERYEVYAIARQWGLLSVNECRAFENMNSIGEQGDVYLQPLNMQSAGEPAAQPGTES